MMEYDLTTALVALVALAVVVLILATIAVLLSSPKPRPRAEDEKYFPDPVARGGKGGRCPFPSLHAPATLDLSVIVPAYNEEERLPIMVDECMAYLQAEKKKNHKFTYEVILVDDGSRDTTTALGIGYTEKYGSDTFRVLTLTQNRGKGGAVRMGMLSGRGRHLLMCDADGATRFSDVARLYAKSTTATANSTNNSASLAELVKANNSNNNSSSSSSSNGSSDVVVVGSRAHLQDEAVAQRALHRNLLMFAFHLLVWFVGIRGIRDTQCGFKLFSRSAAQQLFPAQHVERWCFDIELLYVAQQLGMSVFECSVNWTEIPGSKLQPFWASIQMFKDLFLIRMHFISGVWKLPVK